MKSGTALALGLLSAVAVLIAAPIAFVIAAMWWLDSTFKHSSPIAALSIGKTEEATKEAFRHRVQDTFPIGTSATELQRQLSEQGFRERAGQFRGRLTMVLEYSTDMSCG